MASDTLTFRIEPLSSTEPNKDGSTGTFQLVAERGDDIVSVRKMTTKELSRVISS